MLRCDDVATSLSLSLKCVLLTYGSDFTKVVDINERAIEWSRA